MESSQTERNTFPKSERLRHRSLVEALFREGESLYEYPLRLVWRALSEEQLKSNFRDHLPDRIAPLQMMVTVPKKKRRHAVDRVRMRRLVREAYRLNRRPLRRLVEENPALRTLSVSIIYIATENLPCSTVEKRLNKLLARLSERIKNFSSVSQTGTSSETDV